MKWSYASLLLALGCDSPPEPEPQPNPDAQYIGTTVYIDPTVQERVERCADGEMLYRVRLRMVVTSEGDLESVLVGVYDYPPLAEEGENLGPEDVLRFYVTGCDGEELGELWDHGLDGNSYCGDFSGGYKDLLSWVAGSLRAEKFEEHGF